MLLCAMFAMILVQSQKVDFQINPVSIALLALLDQFSKFVFSLLLFALENVEEALYGAGWATGWLLDWLLG